MGIKRPLIWILSAYLAGLAVYTAALPEAAAIGIGIFLAALLWFLRPGNRRYRFKNYSFLLLLPLLFFFGYRQMNKELLAPAADKEINQKEKAWAEGEISLIEESDKYTRLTLKDAVLTINEGGTYRELKLLTYIDQKASCSIGNRVKVSGTVVQFTQASNPGQFDEYLYYKTKKYHYKFYADSVAITNSKINSYHHTLFTIRKKLTATYYKLLSEKNAGILTAMMLGDTNNLDADIKELYRLNGISHILAISGLHISLLGLALYKIFRQLRMPLVPSTALTLLFLYSYGILTGFSVSTNRAVVMMSVYMAAVLVGRSYELLSGTALSALIILIQSPLEITGAGFLLSFGAVLGIGTVYPAMQKALSPRRDKQKTENGRKGIESKRQVTEIEKKIGKCRRKTGENKRKTGEYKRKTGEDKRKSGGDKRKTGEDKKKAGEDKRKLGEVKRNTGEIKENIAVINRNTVEKGKNSAVTLLGSTAGNIVLQTLLSSLSAQFILLPVLLWFFYEFPIYSPLINLFVIPLSSLLTILAFLSVLAGCFFVPAGVFLMGGVNYILEFYEAVCRLGVKLPHNSFLTGRPEVLVLLIFYVLLFFFVQCNKKKGSKLSLILLFSVIILLVPVKENNLEVTFLDVGQGDGIFLRLPDNTTILIDGGSSTVKNLGKYRLEPFLKYKGIDKIDYAVVTHGDGDHYSGVLEFLQKDYKGDVRIRNLLLPGVSLKGEAYRNLIQAARDKKITVSALNTGDYLKKDGIYLNCLWPDKSHIESSSGDFAEVSDTNSHSVVLSLHYQDFDLLLTGDLEGAGEEAVAERVEKAKQQKSGRPLRYDILKVAHHGSKYSTGEGFLKAVAPAYAIISCGAGNSYGHPHKETINRLADIKCRILQTPESGAVTVITDGKRMRVREWKR